MLVILVNGCMPATPAPRAAARPAAATHPVPKVAPAPADWRDLPETAGSWSYAAEATGSVARFGPPGAAPAFVIRCRRADRRVELVRAGGQPGPMTVTTSYAPMTWPAAAAAGGVAVTLAAADPFLDRLAFSRGRFTVEAAGAPELVLPAWAEPARVVEDCRG